MATATSHQQARRSQRMNSAWAQRRKTLTESEKGTLLKVQGRMNSVVNFGTVDGPGIRYVLFLQGCPLRCLYCHNPDSVHGEGMGLWTVEKALSEIARYRTFIQNGGVTFSGGEPLLQPAFVYALATLLRDSGLHTAIDTSGCIAPNSAAKAIDAADMLLLDIKAADPETSIKLTGRDNRNAFATLDYCEERGKPVWIRHVLLRGYTLEEKQLAELAERLKPYSCVELVELLPFHQYGADKWQKIGREYPLEGVQPTTPGEVDWAKGILAAHGLRVH